MDIQLTQYNPLYKEFESLLFAEFLCVGKTHFNLEDRYDESCWWKPSTSEHSEQGDLQSLAAGNIRV